jgi:hypothetical protein
LYNDANLANPWSANPPIEAIFKNFVAWRNKDNGVFANSLGKVTFENLKLIDNR